MNQLFIISSAVFQAMPMEEVEPTVEALKELGLYKLPYDKVDIQFLFDDIAVCQETGLPFPNKCGPNAYCRLLNVTLDGYERLVVGSSSYQADVTHETKSTDIKFPAMILIAALSSRNIVKTTRENKLAKLGIGKKRNRYRYSTTITLPHVLEDDGTVREGQPKAPHLRRGHIRRQHYGPRGAFIKKIWIQPVFVNADKDFVSTRTHYNLGG